MVSFHFSGAHVTVGAIIEVESIGTHVLAHTKLHGFHLGVINRFHRTSGPRCQPLRILRHH
jgi:hypothetical protein